MMVGAAAEISTRLPPIRDISAAATVCNKEVKMSDTVLIIKESAMEASRSHVLRWREESSVDKKVTYISACAH